MFSMDSTVFGAVLLAVLAMASLIVGVAVGLFLKPSQRTNAIIMAFGTGALIQALALELAYEGAERLVRQGHPNDLTPWLWVASGFLVGGLIYYVVNRLLDERGAALRHPALAKQYVLKKKRQESEALLEHLSKVELLRSLPPEEMEDVLVCVSPLDLRAGETVFHRGDAGNALYLIDSGSIEILINEGDREQVLATLEGGQSFGEMALLTGEPRTATARTSNDTKLLRIDKEHFDELLERSPRLRQAVEDLNSQRLAQNVATSRGTMDADLWREVAVKNIQRLTRLEEMALMRKHAAAGAPLAIFLGAMMDGIPESVVIGSSYVSFETFRFTFLAAVFLSNLPEAIASAVGMKQAGFSNFKVFGLWTMLVVAGGVAAAFGNLYLAAASPTLLTFVGAVAGGGILAMVSSVMMPEAYEDGGPAVGLATIAGFLGAFAFNFL
ncbi:MAG: cyclic nucleotide-binding domain-containing protein [Bacteroidetes bacterium]|jgi:CRP-like cAMP-binding protein|nr:cyclic nucleotide-binding domain-containing protein [Bacteroidota bacterium]